MNALDQNMVIVPGALKAYQPGATTNIRPDDDMYNVGISQIMMTPCSVEVSKAGDMKASYGNTDLRADTMEMLEDMYGSYEEVPGTPGTPEMTRQATGAV